MAIKLDSEPPHPEASLYPVSIWRKTQQSNSIRKKLTKSKEFHKKNEI